MIPERGEIRRVAVMRSARMNQIRENLNDVKSRYPSAEILVLCQPSAREEVSALLTVNGIIEIPEGRFRLDGVSHSLIERVRGEGFDLFVVPYNNSRGEGYLDIERFALLSGARWIASIDYLGRWVARPAEHWFRNRFLVEPLKDCLTFLILGLASTFGLFVAIPCLMAGRLWRRIMKSRRGRMTSASKS
ncbi:MAG: hypothetical protein ACUVXI_01385 [bacterium]